jgi:3(or 17)beta-hydroxysteroid dehydrogenase
MGDLMTRVTGKVAIVTGAGSGMGRADAILLAKQGAKVVVTDLNLASVEETAGMIGDAALAIAHNVSKEADWEAVIAKTVEQFGRLDIYSCTVNLTGTELEHQARAAVVRGIS